MSSNLQALLRPSGFGFLPLMALRPMSAAAAVLLLAACGGGSPGNSGGPEAPVVVTPAEPTPQAPRVLKAINIMPPGQSGHFSTQGQAQGQGSGAPGDYGDNIDDQRLMYWNFEFKDGQFQPEGTPITTTLDPSIRIYQNEFGIPAVYADNIGDAWEGAGYIIAQQRLFLMDAVRRLGYGTFAELTGCGAVPADLAVRVLGYSEAEYQAFFDAMSADSQASVDGYVAGANAWLAEVRLNPNLLPAEYGLLTMPASDIPDFSRRDILASGVLITRTVATEGGTEMQNVAMLQGLQSLLGQANGRAAFQDIVWNEDSLAAVTIPREEGTFSENHPEGANGREQTFNDIADWAQGLPLSLAHGDGTGHAVGPCDGVGVSVFSGIPGPQGFGGGGSSNEPRLGSETVVAASTDENAVKGQQLQDKAMQVALTGKQPNAQAGLRKLSAAEKVEARQKIAAAINAVQAWGNGLHGGSYMTVMNNNRTANGGVLMVNGPQLGYSYPLLLVEIEVHAGEYNARGSTVPGLPVVGIGYNDDVAWGLTTGYSKTIDSYIETICSTAQINAAECTVNQYRFNNAWVDMECRTENIQYREGSTLPAPSAVPFSSADFEVCRTTHGPVVARDQDAGRARALQLAMWQTEIQNIEPIREWNRATSFQDMLATIPDLTWNENLMVASKDGNIAFFHPGRHYRRHADTDQRFPTPGLGEHEPNGFIGAFQSPFSINPEQGFLANWNNKPAYGWLDGVGTSSTSRPGGARERVSVIQDLVGARNDWDFDSLIELDKQLGIIDPKAAAYLPLMLEFRSTMAGSLTTEQQQALDLLADWDGRFYDLSIDPEDTAALTTAATTIFQFWTQAIRDDLFAALRTVVIDNQNTADTADDLTAFDRQQGVGGHVFDMGALDNLALRIMNPASSGLGVNFSGWANGRTTNQILQASLDVAITRMRNEFGADPASWRMQHPHSDICSLTGGVIGPCITMPYQDRGSWLQIIGYEPQ